MVSRYAIGVEHRYVDPVQIEAIAGGPDHAGDPLGAQVDRIQRRSEARRIGQAEARQGIGGLIEAACGDEVVDDPEERRVVGVAIGDVAGEIG